MMRHLGKVGFLCVLFGGCSLIVGNKLDEKGDAGGLVTEAGKIDGLPGDGSAPPPLEKETGRPFFVVGEGFAIPGAHPEWNNVKVVISSNEGAVFCPAALDDQKVMRGVIPSHSPEGTLKLSVLDGTQVLFSVPIEVRRLVLVGAEGQGQIWIFSNDPFEPILDATIDLGAPLQGGRALLAPSGRFLLVSTGPTPQDAKLVLIDLVTGKRANLNAKGFESPVVPGGIPHSFEPVFGPMPTGEELPLLLHYREERVWVVDADGMLWSHEIEALFKSSPKKQGHGSQVQQVLWAAVPAEVPRSVGLIVRNERNAGAPFYKHALIKGTNKPAAVYQYDDIVPGFASYATPLEGTKLRQEVAFALLLHPNPGERRVALIPEAGTMTPPKVLDYGTPATKVVPESLTAIPGTALVGFNFMVYPKISVADTLYGKLKIGSALELQVERRPGGMMTQGQRTDTFPSLRGKARLLMRSGEKLSTFDELAATPKWSAGVPSLTWAAHHPRRETVYATAPGALHQYNYGSSKPGYETRTLVNAPGIGVYIQP